MKTTIKKIKELKKVAEKNNETFWIEAMGQLDEIVRLDKIFLIQQIKN